MALAALLIGCDRSPPPAPPTPGARLEAAAVAAGLVTDPAVVSIAGSWARDNQRICVVPASGATRIGALLDYGDGQGCAASGTVEQAGGTLRLVFGKCRFEARFDGERIVFPVDLPRACETLCTGRASLAGMEVERLSSSLSEAAMLSTRTGRPLCPS